MVCIKIVAGRCLPTLTADFKKIATEAKIEMPFRLKGNEEIVDRAVVILLDLTKVCSRNLFTF